MNKTEKNLRLVCGECRQKTKKKKTEASLWKYSDVAVSGNAEHFDVAVSIRATLLRTGPTLLFPMSIFHWAEMTVASSTLSWRVLRSPKLKAGAWNTFRSRPDGVLYIIIIVIITTILSVSTSSFFFHRPHEIWRRCE